MKTERPRLGVCFFRRRGDRFFPGTLFQDRHRRPQAAGEPELVDTLKSQISSFESYTFLRRIQNENPLDSCFHFNRTAEPDQSILIFKRVPTGVPAWF